MPLLTPNISEALKSVGIGGSSGKDTSDDLWARAGLSDEEVIQDIANFKDNAASEPLRLKALETNMKAKKMLQSDNPVGNVSFQIVINDPGGPQGPNPILIPREVKL